MEESKISLLKLDLSIQSNKSIISTVCTLPNKIPSDIGSYKKPKQHSDFSPDKNLNIIVSHIGYFVDFSKSIGSGSYGKCFVGSKLSSGTSKAHSIGEQSICVKVTDIDRLSTNYRYVFLPRENIALNSITGPNLVTTFETFLITINLSDSREFNYFVSLQELLPFSLSDLVFDTKNKKRNIPFEVIRRIGVQLIDGVTCMHSKGVSHRDLKIANLMDQHYRLKIIDFGFCHLSTSPAATTTSVPLNAIISETICGTKAYFSPELILGNEYSPFLYDSWLSGMVILELVNNELPDIFSLVSQNGHFDDKFIRFDASPPEDIQSLIKQLLVIESKRIALFDAKQLPFYTGFDESLFWKDYDSGKIMKIYDILKSPK